MQLGYTIIYVNSVKNTLEFYEQAFNLKIKFLHESKDYGELETGSTILAFASEEVVQFNQMNNYLKVSQVDKQKTYEIVFVTDDVQASYNKAITSGAIALKEPEKKPWGQIVGYVKDINGTVVELCNPISS